MSVQPTTPDDLSMRGMLDDTLKQLHISSTPLLASVPTEAPKQDETKPPISRQEQLLSILIVLILCAAGYIIYARFFAPLERGAAAGSPALPTAPPALSPTPPPIMLPAYAAPGGAELGPIESTRAITPTAHYGAGWIQADVQGSGRIWLRAADVPSLAIVGPDLAPPPTATRAPIPPTATPAPQPPCHSAGTGAQIVTVCGWGDLDAQARDQWIATYGAAAPTPYGGTK